MVLVEKTGWSPIEIHIFQYIVAPKGFIEFLSSSHVVESHLIESVGSSGRGGIHLDGFHLVGLVVDTDNVSFLQVAGFWHNKCSFLIFKSLSI